VDNIRGVEGFDGAEKVVSELEKVMILEDLGGTEVNKLL
jgi:hypothetical protein